MSNVLIGIIGVILFIGLALAGALILGDDFKSASAGSKAAATMAQAQQIAAAINMYKLKTGRNMTTLEYRDNATTLLVPRFLKAVPTFPNPAGGAYQIQDTSGLNNNNNPVFIVAADLPRSASSRAICQAAAEGFGKEIEDGYYSMTAGTAGCVYSSADPLYFAIYVKI
jgi:hypothetical protein